MVYPAKFITLEGIEGVGKTSCMSFTQQYFLSKGINVKTTREPGGTDIAEKIRNLLLSSGSEHVHDSTELMLLTAARNQHINNFIKPNLHAGNYIISDRYIDSTYAYQAGGRGINSSIIDKYNSLLEDVLEPDITFLLDASFAVSQERLALRNQKKDRFEREDETFFNKVRHKYLELAALYPQRIKIIDASKSMTDVQQQILVFLEAM